MNATGNRRDLQREVAERIVAQLETGVAPWSKPWSTSKNELKTMVTLPLRACGKAYRGINIFLLWGSADDNQFKSRYWLTFKQAQALKATVKKGSKGTKVYYSDKLIKSLADDKRKRGVQPNPGDELVTRPIWFLREYTVFNADQCDGLPERFYHTPAERSDIESFKAADDFLGRAGARIEHGSDMAAYSPMLDLIVMPDRNRFQSSHHYYATLAHEHIHWTGHDTRLNRGISAVHDDAYAIEEMVAEMGAAFICAETGLSLEPRPDHASYIQTWIDAIKAKPQVVFGAATKAAAAVDFIRGDAGDSDDVNGG